MRGSYVADLHTLDEDREVETSCIPYHVICLDDIMKFLDYPILT